MFPESTERSDSTGTHSISKYYIFKNWITKVRESTLATTACAQVLKTVPLKSNSFNNWIKKATTSFLVL